METGHLGIIAADGAQENGLCGIQVSTSVRTTIFVATGRRVVRQLPANQ